MQKWKRQTLCVFICGKRSRLSLNIKRVSFCKDIAWKTLALGMPSALSVIVMSVSGIVSNNVLGQFGYAAIAYNYGAGNLSRIGMLMKATTFVILITGAVMSFVGFLLREQFLSAFLRDPAIMDYGEKLILAGVVTGPICGISSLCSSYLQATERIVPAMVNSLLQQGFYIPLYC